MPRPRRQLLRRRRLVPDEVDHVEAVGELHERDVVLEVPRASPADAIVNRRWPGDEPERNPIAADDQPARRVPRRHGELRRRARDRMLHHLARNPRQARLVIHERPGLGEDGPGGGAHELDADLLEQAQRGVVHGSDLLLVEELDRGERVDGRSAGERRGSTSPLAPRGSLGPSSSRHTRHQAIYNLSCRMASDPRRRPGARPRRSSRCAA